MPLSGQPKRFSFHMETNVKTTKTKARSVISKRLKDTNARFGCSCAMEEKVYAVLESLTGMCVTRLGTFGLSPCWSLVLNLSFASFQTIKPFRM